MSKPKIYFARAIDLLEPRQVQTLSDRVGTELHTAGFDMIDTFSLIGEINNTNLEESVQAEIALISECQGVLVDLSIPDWPYVGCLFEIAYAYRASLPVAVYVEDSTIAQRPWLRYHASDISKQREDSITYLRLRLLAN